MSTRSVTYVYDDGIAFFAMYRQSYGYPAGMGQDLLDFLAPFKLTNGLSTNNPEHIANGMGCLAAQLVAHFKSGAGGIYIVSPQIGIDHGQEYEYHIYLNAGGKLFVQVRELGMEFPLFDGPLTADDFGQWIIAQED